MAVRSPLTWLGVKYNQASHIISLFPSHDHYIEVFGGALHVFMRKEPIILETINDKYREVINFWLACRDHSEELMRKIDWTPYSRALMTEWRNAPEPDDPIERAARWFYVHSACVNSCWHSSWSRQKRRSDINVPAGERFRRRVDRILAMRDRLAHVQIECLDFREMIEHYGDCESNLMYLDPPYVGSEKEYEEVFTEQDHLDLAEMLHEMKAKAVLSYGDDPLTAKLYKDWVSKKVIVTRQCAPAMEKRPKATEVIYMNYVLQPELFSYPASEVCNDPENPVESYQD